MVESFESYRSYLFAIAYRMLGSAMDAQDMVQETYLRYSVTPKDSITSLKAFLTTIITRLCMDQLHLARRKRDVYLGPWLPEPLITPEALEAVSLEERVDMEESISLAFLVLLEQLQPSPISGRDAVARFALGTRRFLPEGARVELAAVNGQLALVFRAGDRAYLVLAIEVEAQQIQTVRVMVNPEKLARV